MNRMLLAVSALVFMSGTALARDVQGTVMHFNTATRTVTLQNGRTYTIPRHVAMPKMKVGQRVSINFNDEGDKIQNVFTSTRRGSR